MPIGKNASYRYRLIDQALRRKHHIWTIDDLKEFVSEKLSEEFDIYKGISMRQLLDDIRIMRKDPPEGFGAPIIRKDGEIFYEDPEFSINDNPLNDVDIDTLNEVLNLLKPFQSLPHTKEVELIVGKIKGTLSKNEGDEVIQLDHNPEVKGLKYIDPLYKAIKNRKVIMLNYQPFNVDEVMNFEIHPYLIKEYNNRWFLLGWHPEESRFSVFGLDRIENISLTEEMVDKSKREHLLKLQSAIIGVSMDQEREPQVIEIWANTKQLKYLLTKPIHLSQKLKEQNQEGGVIQLTLYPNFELEQKILSFGENVKVLHPDTLKDKILSRINSMSSNY